MIYVRWRKGESRRLRVFPPLPADHPATTKTCPGCGQPCGTTRPVQLIAVGSDDEEGQRDHDAGRWYTATGVLLHEECAAVLTDAELDNLASQLVPVEGTPGETT